MSFKNSHLRKKLQKQRGHIDKGQDTYEASTTQCPHCKNPDGLAFTVRGAKCLTCGWEQHK